MAKAPAANEGAEADDDASTTNIAMKHPRAVLNESTIPSPTRNAANLREWSFQLGEREVEIGGYCRRDDDRRRPGERGDPYRGIHLWPAWSTIIAIRKACGYGPRPSPRRRRRGPRSTPALRFPGPGACRYPGRRFRRRPALRPPPPRAWRSDAARRCRRRASGAR